MTRPLLSKVEGRDEWLFWCPGCKCAHCINASWTFDGNHSAPTVHPSVLVRGYSEELKSDTRCHLFVRAGRIQFLGDCTHDLAGQTVDMEPL